MKPIKEKSILRVHEVERLLGTSRTTIWRWVRSGIFPSPLQIGPNTIAWRTADIEDWLQSRPVVAYGCRGRQMIRDRFS